MNPQTNLKPLLRPDHEYVDPFRLDQECLSSSRQLVVTDHYEKFFMGRFKMLTSPQQAALLAQRDAELFRAGTKIRGEDPIQFSMMREKFGCAENRRITEAFAVKYYLDLCEVGRRMWFSRLLREPETKAGTEDKIFDVLRTQLPVIAYTLAHIWDGGLYGLMTARGGRDAHRIQMQLISRLVGFAAAEELIYYVSDEKRGKRLLGSTAEKKAQAQVNFVTGRKFDENNTFLPMQVETHFDGTIFTDDECKNLRGSLQCVVRDVISMALMQAGLKHRVASDEHRITEKAKVIADREYDANRLRSYQDPKFWVKVVEEVLGQFHTQTRYRGGAEKVIDRLKADELWLPDRMLILDGRTIDVDECIARLRKRLADPAPLEIGSKKVILFNDIDGNLLDVKARFYVREKNNPDSPALLVFDQATWAEHPNVDYWTKKVAEEKGLKASDLEVDFKHFRDQEAIEQDILRAMHGNEIFRNPYLH